MTTARIVYVFGGLVFLAACNRGRDAAASIFELPVHGADRTVVLGAIANLQEIFNRGDCMSIYQDAATAFRGHPADNWQKECDGLRASLGTWQRFSATWVRLCGAPQKVICVSGSVTFAQGPRLVETIWLLHSGRADLMVLGWQDGPQWIQIPRVPGRKFYDPPERDQPIVSAATRNP